MAEPGVLSPAEAAAASSEGQAGKVPAPAVGWHAAQPAPTSGVVETPKPATVDGGKGAPASPDASPDEPSLLEQAAALLPRAQVETFETFTEDTAPYFAQAGMPPNEYGRMMHVVAEVERTALPVTAQGASLPQLDDVPACESFMRDYWGADFKKNQRAVASYLAKKLSPEAAEHLDSTGAGNHVGVLQALLFMADGTSKLSPAAAQKALDAIMRDTAHPYWKGSKPAVARVALLTRLASGNAGTRSAAMPSFPKPTAVPAPTVAKSGPSVDELQAEIIQTTDRETRTRLIAELRARYQAEGA